MGVVKQLAVVVVVVGMLDYSVDTHHCSVDTDELFHAYFVPCLFLLCLNIASFLENSISHSAQVVDIVEILLKTSNSFEGLS